MKNQIILKILYIFCIINTLIFINSCSSERKGVKYVCNCEQLEKVNGFIERSIPSANNMSDEEMEDVIHQLWVTGVITTCHQKIFILNSHYDINWNISENKIDSCEVVYNSVY